MSSVFDVRPCATAVPGAEAPKTRATRTMRALRMRGLYPKVPDLAALHLFFHVVPKYNLYPRLRRFGTDFSPSRHDSSISSKPGSLSCTSAHATFQGLV